MQNWNSLFSYIRQQLGSVNQLELTDNELQIYIKEHTLRDFSNYSSDKLWVLITDSNKVEYDLNKPDRIMDEDSYKIPLPSESDYIINIEDAYYRRSGADWYDSYPYMYQSDPRDTVMNNTMSTMLAYLNKVQYYQYLPPDTIIFGSGINEEGVILELNIVHTILDRIKRDVYHGLFKKMALYDILDLLIMNRSKFQEVASPFGQINLNIEILERKKEKLEQEIQEYKSWQPPEKLISWID